MPFPTPKVYVAFDDGPYVVSPTWTDISTYVLEINVDRGRDDDYGQFIGTASVTLNNNSGIFNYQNTSGTYYGKLLPNRQIKIEGIANSTTYGVFRGYVAGWPMRFTESGFEATVTIQCFDALSLLAQEQIDPVPADTYVLSLSPTWFYKCNEAITVGAYGTVIDYSGNGYDLTASSPSGAARYPTNNASLADGLPYQSLNFNNNVVASRTTGTNSGYGTMSLACWVVNQFGGTTPDHSFFFGYGTGTIVVGFTSTGQVRATVTTALGTGFVRTTDATWNWNTGEAHHIAVTFTSGSGTCNIYVDGANMATSSAGSGFAGVNPYGASIGTDIFQHVAAFPTALSAAQVANIYALSANRYSETTTVRANRVLDKTSFPAGLRSLTASPAGTVSEGGIGAMSVATELQKINYSEGGNLYVSKTGTLTMTNRTDNITAASATTPQATFNNDVSADLDYGNPIEISYDADDIINAVTVNYTGSANVTTTNSTSITSFGRKAATWDTYNATYTDAVDLATVYTKYGQVARPKLSPIQAGVTVSATEWQTLLDLELLERVKFTMTPKTGTAFTQNVIVQKLQHRIVPGQWNMAITGSGRYAAFFVLDYSALDGPDVLY